MNRQEKKIFTFLKNVYKLDFKTCILPNADIKNIVNIIEDQQKEIGKLRDDLKEERNFNKSALETLKDCVHKDRIRKIIEEYNKKCDECNFNKSGICKELKAYNCCSIQSVLELLKVLIGETK